MTVLVWLVVLLGMIVIVPLGLRLLGLRRPARWWPVAAVPVAVAVCLPRGPLAALLCLPYVLAAFALPLLHLRRARTRQRSRPPQLLRARDLAVMTALVCPAIAATALVSERAGVRLFGFSLRILQLTVAHFHFAGFAAALMAGLVATNPGRLSGLAALAVPAGTLTVLTGFFVGDWVEFAGAVVLTAGMWLVGLLSFPRRGRAGGPRRVAGAYGADRLTSALFAVSASVLAISMLPALDWALGQATGFPHLSMTWMGATHGVCNAGGFALCGLIGWTRIRKDTAWT